eukprot:4868424-Prymnesium_polylepis.2
MVDGMVDGLSGEVSACGEEHSPFSRIRSVFCVGREAASSQHVSVLAAGAVCAAEDGVTRRPAPYLGADPDTDESPLYGTRIGSKRNSR